MKHLMSQSFAAVQFSNHRWRSVFSRSARRSVHHVATRQTSWDTVTCQWRARGWQRPYRLLAKG